MILAKPAASVRVGRHDGIVVNLNGEPLSVDREREGPYQRRAVGGWPRRRARARTSVVDRILRGWALQAAGAPPDEVDDRRAKSAALVGQLVEHRWRRSWGPDGAGNDARDLEAPAKAGRENVRADPGQTSEEVGVATGVRASAPAPRAEPSGHQPHRAPSPQGRTGCRTSFFGFVVCTCCIRQLSLSF